MEVKIFPKPAVAGILDNMVEARLHFDSADDAVKAKVKSLQDELVQSFATPIYLVMNPRTGEIYGRRDGALLDEALFAEWLQQSLPAGK